MLLFTALPVHAVQEELPICAKTAGVYLQAERAQPGARLLSSYLHSFTTMTAKVYTEYSRNKLFIFQTIVPTPYAGNAPFNPYFEEVTQIEPYVFQDRRGRVFTFEMDENERPVELVVNGERWIPSGGMTSAFMINTTILLLQLLCLYLVINIFCTALYTYQHHQRRWIGLIATKLNTALTVVLSAAMFNNAILLIWGVPTLAYSQLNIFFLLNMLFMVLLPALCLAIALTAKKSELDTRQKACYTINIAWALILFVLMILWQLYH